MILWFYSTWSASGYPEKDIFVIINMVTSRSSCMLCEQVSSYCSIKVTAKATEQEHWWPLTTSHPVSQAAVLSQGLAASARRLPFGENVVWCCVRVCRVSLSSYTGFTWQGFGCWGGLSENTREAAPVWDRAPSSRSQDGQTHHWPKLSPSASLLLATGKGQG